MVETFAAGKMGMEEMQHVMSLQVYNPELLDNEILCERVAVVPSQPENLFTTMMVPNMTERLQEIQIPIFGFWGTEDKFNPHSGSMKILHNAPDARMILLNRCGHWVQVEYPDLFNRSCIDFLTRG